MFGDEDDFDRDAPDVDEDDFDRDFLDDYGTETSETEDKDSYDDDNDVDLDDFDWDAPDVDVEDLDLDLLDEYEMETQGLGDDGETRRAYAADSDNDDSTIYFYGDDDYKTVKEYQGMLEEEYGWREDVEDRSVYNLDPEDFETREDYEEALDDAMLRIAEKGLAGEDYDDSEDDDSISVSLPLSFSIEVSYQGKEYLEKIKEEDYPNKRTYDAAYALCEIEHGDPYIPSGTTKEAEADRYRFILSQGCIAARYLTQYDGFIYVQAIKDHFKLPIEVADEDEEVKNYFPDFFMELAEENINLAIDIWAWCIKEFGAYSKYMENHWTLYNGILSSIEDYPDNFIDCLIDRLGIDEAFRSGLLCNSPDAPYRVPELVVRALQTNRVKIAQAIFAATMQNSTARSRWKEGVLEDIISECSNWEELETMESFQKHILPIAENIADKRIQRVLPKMAKKVEDYIRSVESSEAKYQFSRRFSWRATCIDGSKYGISPLDYEEESDYLIAIEEQKYGWRKYLAPSKLRFANPMDYETAEEFHAAVREAVDRETRSRVVSHHNENNKNVYMFCKVKMEEEPRNTYYYFPGGLQLHIGDCVIVPLGRDNREVYGTVVSVGECYGSALPCEIEKIKYVMRKK